MSIGAEALVREWRADAAIVTEPTDLQMAVGHKGFAWVEVVTRGRAAHGSRPAEGRDAIARMGRVLVLLEARDRELRARPPSPYPGHRIDARVDHHRRPRAQQLSRSVHAPDGAPDGERRGRSRVMSEIDDALARLRLQDREFEGAARVTGYRSAYCLDPSHRLPQALGRALGQSGRSPDPVGMSFWTDAALLAGAGIPSILFGPGGAGLHSTVEYVNVDDVYACRDILSAAVNRLLAV